MKPFCRLLGCIVAAALCSAAHAQASNNLQLTDQPVGTTSSIEPNILVAVDNSGSMDYETLFQNTGDGLLYLLGDSAWADGHLRSSSDSYSKTYAYLFPNGYGGKGQKLYDENIQGAIPPIPQYAFARSSSYNKAYFNPGENYTPWVNYPSLDTASQWQNAPYDPTVPGFTLDLTSDQSPTQNEYGFDVSPGMFSGGVTYLYCASYQQCASDSGTWRTDPPGSTFPMSGSSNRAVYLDYSTFPFGGYGGGFGGYGGYGTHQLAIRYFPATFYMPASWDPASIDFGWSGGYDAAHPDQVLYGYGPDGQKTLKRYRIVPGNFVSTAAYQAAITNFANWFTYYRKRNLAIRGGVTSAFNDIANARVASCSINQAESRVQNGQYDQLKMYDLSDSSQRQTFYQDIYGLNFYQALGTPNRPAIYYLGRELEENPTIIQSPCQRNYAILFTDGLNTSTMYGIGNVDGQYDRNDPNSPVPDNYSNTMADIAMRFYKQLQPPAKVDVPNQLALPAGCPGDPSLDCEASLHMVTYGVTLGLHGVIYGNTQEFPEANSDPYAHPPPWYLYANGSRIPAGNMPAGGQYEIDDLWHATIDTHGALLNASSPAQIANQFSTAINQILGRGETLTNAAGNGRTLTTQSTVYQTRYDPVNWSGDLIAYNADGGSPQAGQRDWSAADQLPGFSKNASDDRTIITDLRDNQNTPGWSVTGIPFTAQALGNTAFPSLTADKISYLRGNRSLEQHNGGSFRDRAHDTSAGGADTVLGDIIHSVPTYVGPPQPVEYAGTWHDDLYPKQSMPENKVPYYSQNDPGAFANTESSRTPMVYVGANDGMLHGFDADTGQEKLAFVPNAVLGKIGADQTGLQSPDYQHQSFVDGQTTADNVFFDNAWHTMLVGGLRDGGRTIYGLDITNPADFSQANAGNIVRWEFRDSDLGQTYGKPVITRLHNGQWAAIFGNGYNSDRGSAVLYIVAISDGHLIRKIDTGAVPQSGQPSNGLAGPAVLDLDHDHIADYVYAGDYYGNLWKFDLTSDNPADWTVHKLFQARRGSNSGPAQPITTTPVVRAHPYGAGYGAMIYFGTGQDIIAHNNQSDSVGNSFYGIWDPAVFTYDAPDNLPQAPASWQVSRDQLVTQTVSSTQTVNGSTYRTVTDNPVDYVDSGQFGDRGWALDLPSGKGEAVLSTPVINTPESRVEFNTTIINSGTCTLTTSGYLMAADLSTGGPPADSVFDVNGDGQIDQKDRLTTDNGTQEVVSGVGFQNGSAGNLARFVDMQNNTVKLVGVTTANTQVSMAVSNQTQRIRKTWREIRP